MPRNSALTNTPSSPNHGRIDDIRASTSLVNRCSETEAGNKVIRCELENLIICKTHAPQMIQKQKLREVSRNPLKVSGINSHLSPQILISCSGGEDQLRPKHQPYNSDDPITDHLRISQSKSPQRLQYFREPRSPVLSKNLNHNKRAPPKGPDPVVSTTIRAVMVSNSQPKITVFRFPRGFSRCHLLSVNSGGFYVHCDWD